MERVLSRGVVHPTGRTVGGGENVNGALRVVRATLGAEHVDAVEKPATAQAVQEVVGARIAQLFEIRHLFPAAVLRNDAALIALSPGVAAGQRGVRDVASLDAALGAAYAASGRHRAAPTAARDRQLLGTYDYVLANDDRHPANLLVDRARVSAIDQGSIGNGEMPDALVPRLGPWYQGGGDGGRVTLDAAALRVLRGIDPRRLDEELAALSAASSQPGLANRLLPGVASPVYAHRVQDRLRHVQEAGGYDWISSLAARPPSPPVLPA